MYSKNDYRYYLENQLMHSNDFLAHYGVKGMKWKHHKANKTPSLNDAVFNNPDSVRSILDAQERGKQRTISEKKRMEKKAAREWARAYRNTADQQRRGEKRTGYEDRKIMKGVYRNKVSSEYKSESAYNSKKNNFPKSNTKPKTKKKTIKQKASSIRKKYGLYRETPKGKKLKGGGNIYVSHS